MATKTKRSVRFRKPQFNFIELVLLALLLVGLGSFSVMSIRDLSQRHADSERQRDIRTMQAALEDYYAQNERYPTLDQLNSNAWRSKEVPSLQTNDTSDPEGRDWRLAVTPSQNRYAYSPTTTDGAACDNTTVDCMKYTLSVTRSDATVITRTNYN